MKKARSRPKKEWGKDLEWVKGVWEGERSERIKRDREKWGRYRTDPLYRNFIILNRSRCVERCRALKRRFLAVEELSRIYREVYTVKEALWIEQAVEKLSSKQKVSRWNEVAIEGYRECDKKQPKGLDRWPSYWEVSNSCQDCLKSVFQEEKNIDMNAIKHAIHQWSKQHFKLSNSSLNKKIMLSTWIQKIHTHTLNTSNQFYISKIS